MAPMVERPAPLFQATAVEDGFFETVKLTQYLGQWVVLLFYPLDWTFVCPTEILAFNSHLPEFAALNTKVLAISTDSAYSHLAWSNTKVEDGGLGPGLKLSMVADKSMKISRDYGVLLEDEGVALRGLFIVDPKGILRQMSVNGIAVGRSVDETLRLVKALQFTDEHGELCPANWDPSKEDKKMTMKADPKGKLEWFAAEAAKGAAGIKRATEEILTNGDSKKSKAA